jgi:hypothetical protein
MAWPIYSVLGHVTSTRYLHAPKNDRKVSDRMYINPNVGHTLDVDHPLTCGSCSASMKISEMRFHGNTLVSFPLRKRRQTPKDSPCSDVCMK